MVRSRALIAGLAVATSLTIGAVASSALAAPARSAAATVQLVKLKRSDKQFRQIAARVTTCPASAVKITTATRLRNAAVRNAKLSKAATLRVKNAKLRLAVKRMVSAAGLCTTPSTPSVVAPIKLIPGGKGFTSTPVTPGTPGAPAGTGDVGGTVNSVALTLQSLLNGVPIDLSSVLGSAVLPLTLNLVNDNELNVDACNSINTACVGIDPVLLQSSLNNISAGIPLIGPFLNQVTVQVSGNNLSGIFAVERVSDTVVRVVPVGPLATLRVLLGNLSSAPSTAIGHFKEIH